MAFMTGQGSMPFIGSMDPSMAVNGGMGSMVGGMDPSTIGGMDLSMVASGSTTGPHLPIAALGKGSCPGPPTSGLPIAALGQGLSPGPPTSGLPIVALGKGSSPGGMESIDGMFDAMWAQMTGEGTPQPPPAAPVSGIGLPVAGLPVAGLPVAFQTGSQNFNMGVGMPGTEIPSTKKSKAITPKALPV